MWSILHHTLEQDLGDLVLEKQKNKTKTMASGQQRPDHFTPFINGYETIMTLGVFCHSNKREFSVKSFFFLLNNRK